MITVHENLYKSMLGKLCSSACAAGSEEQEGLVYRLEQRDMFLCTAAPPAALIEVISS